jgi:hypothetical protein
MGDDAHLPEPSRSRWQRFRSWAGSLALVFGLVIAAILIAELAPVQALAGRIDAARELHPGLIAIPILLMVVGGAMMLGAQFLPSPRQQTSPTNEALDGAAVPMGYGEARGRWSRSFEMVVSTEQLREGWRRRSWRYSRKWRVFFLMLIGACLLGAGIAALFILVGPPFIKVLAAGLFALVAVRILWEVAVR